MFEHAIKELQAGRTVTIHPRGHSMEPLIKDGQEVTLEPVKDINKVKIDDVVLCKVKGRIFLHLVKSGSPNGLLLIGNNKGHINGWTKQIYGAVRLK